MEKILKRWWIDSFAKNISEASQNRLYFGKKLGFNGMKFWEAVGGEPFLTDLKVVVLLLGRPLKLIAFSANSHSHHFVEQKSH